MKICQLSDIHWRGLSRHEEFIRAFQKAFEQMSSLCPDVIAITGDIFDTKTQGISPEVIDHLVWWFNELSKIAPVHVILGNHDGNLQNASRQDAISPIISAMSNKNIHLYKKSGVYPFFNDGKNQFNWCVFSCFDEDGWSSVKPVQGDINIALFHGSVEKASTDVGFELESDVKIDFFDGYDFVLLGDIHQMQFLDYRDSELIVEKEDLKNYQHYEIIETIND